MTEPVRITGRGFPLDSGRAEHKALMAEHVVQLMADVDQDADDFPEELLLHCRQLAQHLPTLWTDGELPEPAMELMRRFGPEAG
jgi:hypothetical protein